MWTKPVLKMQANGPPESHDSWSWDFKNIARIGSTADFSAPGWLQVLVFLEFKARRDHCEHLGQSPAPKQFLGQSF